MINKTHNTTVELDIFGMPQVKLAKTKVKSKPKAEVSFRDVESPDGEEVPDAVKKNSTM